MQIIMSGLLLPTNSKSHVHCLTYQLIYYIYKTNILGQVKIIKTGKAV